MRVLDSIFSSPPQPYFCVCRKTISNLWTWYNNTGSFNLRSAASSTSIEIPGVRRFSEQTARNLLWEARLFSRKPVKSYLSSTSTVDLWNMTMCDGVHVCDRTSSTKAMFRCYLGLLDHSICPRLNINGLLFIHACPSEIRHRRYYKNCIQHFSKSIKTFLKDSIRYLPFLWATAAKLLWMLMVPNTFWIILFWNLVKWRCYWAMMSCLSQWYALSK